MTIHQAQDCVLSTLEKDGRRHWIKPRLSHGRFLKFRAVVAWFLILLFLALPWLQMNGKPLILLDILHRRFVLFGYTFLPTDTVLLALFMVGLFVAIFLFTALFGRLWCGWACPQTVYLEFIYRPLERLFEGTLGRGGAPRATLPEWRKALYLLAALVVSVIPAHSFLAYFVGVDQLLAWIRQSPFHHPTAFLVMAATTLLMLFDFYYFREQLCILACPYGRFQSVLLDAWSLIVSYDPRRGEPRGKAGTVTGDCVDCKLCVLTCPTGIDIRDGLQMECINCTQCIDACDAVMDKIHKPRGLIRYSSQAAIEGQKTRILRPRIILYPAILLILVALLVAGLVNKPTTDVTLLRAFGAPFTVLPSGEVANGLRLKLTNRTDHPAAYTFEVVGAPGARVVTDEKPLAVAAGAARTEGVLIALPRDKFAQTGACQVTLRVSDGAGFVRDLPCRLLGPASTDERHHPEDSEHGENHERH